MADEAKGKGNGNGYGGGIRHLSNGFLQKYKDVNKTVKLKPDWSSPLGLGLGLGQYNDDAVWAYKKGLEIFWPEMWARLTADPTTRAYLKQPDFVKMMHAIHKDSTNLNFYLKDPRVMQAFHVFRIPTDDAAAYMPEAEERKRAAEPEPEPMDSTEEEPLPSPSPSPPERNAEAHKEKGAMEGKSYLKVSYVYQLLELPSTLRTLRIEECHSLESLQNVPLDKCTNLFHLSLTDCCSLKYFPDAWHPSSLRTLYVHNCRNLEFNIMQNFENLETLSIGNSCDSLKSFTLNHFPKLKLLCIRGCPNLESFSISDLMDGPCHNNNLSLESLAIQDCPNLVSFPTQGLFVPSLRSLTLSKCKNLRSLPNYMTTLTSLQFLFLGRCPQLESLPAGGLPSSLTLLSIAFCDKLTPQKDWNLQSLTRLHRFELESGCIGLKSFPEKDLLPITLNSLYIAKLPRLQVLDCNGLQQLTALQSLEINCCQNLYSLPQALPPSLTFLCIKQSSSWLTWKLLNQAGEDWFNIAHICSIQIDDTVISSKQHRWQTRRPSLFCACSGTTRC